MAAAAMVLLRNATSEPSAVAEAGMMAYIDPETGELTTGPAPASEVEVDADLKNALRRDDTGLEVVTHADGSKSMDLQGRYQHVSVIRIDENGLMTVCTDNMASVAHNLSNQPVSHPNTLEVK
jgi:hypothetical protein